MSRNLIICADGTGNKGGYTPDSNVYKMYHCIDLHDKEQKQIAFYDNGVGTSSNKFLKAVTGALGFGFKRNVKELYRYLSRTYVDGDKMFFFGFSRGAATVRSCISMICTMGLIDGRKLDPQQLEEVVDLTFDYYAKVRRYTEPEQQVLKDGLLSEFKQKLANKSYLLQTPRIHFVGVWDTVAALGFPKRLRVKGFFSTLLNNLFQKLDLLLDILFAHRFYAYDLPDSVDNAYQALAIDDQRKTFWPLVWDETNTNANVEQVWFAGVHSNVGGGYQRQGLANISFHWMFLRAQKHGLKFPKDKQSKLQKDANDQGYLYDSRAGLGAFYRYYPRDLSSYYEEELVSEKPIKVHQSVVERMDLRIGEYSPIIMPPAFDVVSSELDQGSAMGKILSHIDVSNDPDWQFQDSQVRDGVEQGINLYSWFMWLTAFSFILPLLVEFACPSCTEVENAPSILDYWTHFYFTTYPVLGVILLVIYLALAKFNEKMGKKIANAAWLIARIIVKYSKS